MAKKPNRARSLPGQVSVSIPDSFIAVDGERLYMVIEIAPVGLETIEWQDGSGLITFADGETLALDNSNFGPQVGRYVALWKQERIIQSGEEIPPTFEQAKAEKLVWLEDAFETASQTGLIESAVGLTFTASDRAFRNIEGLIVLLTSEGGPEQVYFGDHLGEIFLLTLPQVKTLRLELIKFGQDLYAKKWDLRDKINKATNFAELAAIQWE